MKSILLIKDLDKVRKRIEGKILVCPETGCHLWLGSKNRWSGYGSLRIEGRTWGIHRLVYELHYGPIPTTPNQPCEEQLCVLHRCDVGICCNPEHLFLGTRADNSRDMADKCRVKVDDSGRCYGTAFYELRGEIRSVAEWAKAFGRSESVMKNRLESGWDEKHLELPEEQWGCRFAGAKNYRKFSGMAEVEKYLAQQKQQRETQE